VDEFNKIADEYTAQGWFAEAAYMRKTADGSPKPIIPDGAAPYAAVRVDLVNPETQQPGRIGDSPLMVGLEGFVDLAQLSVTSRCPAQEYPFPVYISTQTPWNNLPIQIHLIDDSPQVIDAVIGSWYEEGFNGAFGSRDKGMLHEISSPEECGKYGVLYYVDCGRAEMSAIEDLISRLSNQHSRTPIAAVLFGNGLL
jgi:hypothetical protein